jgi:hypothetical protein
MAVAEQVGREAELRPDEAPKVNVNGIEETVTDKGYHSGAVVKRMKAYGVRSYISEKKQKGRRNWAGKAEEQQAVYANRRRVQGEYGKSLLRRRGELVERSFAHCYETGAMRRCHLRGQENIWKRQLIHVGAFNLSLILRQLLGAGTPREWKNRAGQVFWRFLRFLSCLMKPFRLPGDLPPLLVSPSYHLSVAACLVTAREISVFCHGLLGPFGRVGAIIEGNPTQNLKMGTVTRSIYVVDVAYGSKGDGVELYVYKKVDTITSSEDTVRVTLSKTVSLPLTGGSATVASMAANKNFLFIGTNQDQLAVQIQKSNFAITEYSGISDPINVSAITADAYGYVTTTWGTGQGFYVIAPNGEAVEDGGGASFMLNTIQAAVPFTLP